MFYLIVAIFVSIVFTLVKTKKAHFVFGAVVLALGI